MLRLLSATCLALQFGAAGARPGPEAEAPLYQGPTLSAASHFSQGRQTELPRLAKALGLEDFRDGINWGRVERVPGDYQFDNFRTNYPELIGEAAVGVVLNWGNPLYDDGDTPHSAEAVAAFGRFAAAVAKAFPNIDNLEIGNEFNGVNFVKGPVRDMTPEERARAYAQMLSAASKAARAARPEIRILGVGTHSLPGAYIWEVLDAAGADAMDAIAVHPYTTPAEQLRRQISVLRRHPTAADLPFEVTEFGTPDTDTAAAHFMKNFCQMALSGVTRVAWYPLTERGDQMVPLLDPKGRMTEAGRAFKLAKMHMEHRDVRDIGIDAFTYGCVFGSDTAVIWGVPRSLEVKGGVEVLKPNGDPLAPPYALHETQPLVLRGEAVGEAFSLGSQTRLADSYHQFAYPTGDEARAEGDAFARFARRGDRIVPLVTLPGQDAPGTPWYPYRGNSNLRPMRLTAEHLVPGRVGGDAVEVVHSYSPEEGAVISVSAIFEVGERSDDGITVTVTLDEESLFHQTGRGVIDVDIADLAMSAGSVLEIVVGPNERARGDITQYRIILERDES